MHSPLPAGSGGSHIYRKPGRASAPILTASPPQVGFLQGQTQIPGSLHTMCANWVRSEAAGVMQRTLQLGVSECASHLAHHLHSVAGKVAEAEPGGDAEGGGGHQPKAWRRRVLLAPTCWRRRLRQGTRLLSSSSLLGGARGLREAMGGRKELLPPPAPHAQGCREGLGLASGFGGAHGLSRGEG